MLKYAKNTAYWKKSFLLHRYQLAENMGLGTQQIQLAEKGKLFSYIDISLRKTWVLAHNKYSLLSELMQSTMHLCSKTVFNPTGCEAHEYPAFYTCDLGRYWFSSALYSLRTWCMFSTHRVLWVNPRQKPCPWPPTFCDHVLCIREDAVAVRVSPKEQSRVAHSWPSQRWFVVRVPALNFLRFAKQVFAKGHQCNTVHRNVRKTYFLWTLHSFALSCVPSSPNAVFLCSCWCAFFFSFAWIFYQ